MLSNDIHRELADLAGRLDPGRTPERAAAGAEPLLDALRVGHCDHRANLLMVAALMLVAVARLDRAEAAAKAAAAQAAAAE